MKMPVSNRLSKEQAQQMIEECGSLIIWTHYETRKYFFTDLYYFPNDMEKDGDNWVPCSVRLPLRVEPREGLESGIVSTLDEYLLVFQYDGQELEKLPTVA